MRVSPGWARGILHEVCPFWYRLLQLRRVEFGAGENGKAAAQVSDFTPRGQHLTVGEHRGRVSFAGLVQAARSYPGVRGLVVESAESGGAIAGPPSGEQHRASGDQRQRPGGNFRSK